MNEEQKEKARFVKVSLAPLLVYATDLDVRDADYLVKKHEELVEITYSNGYARRVCVTGDSLTALARDVLAAV